MVFMVLVNGLGWVLRFVVCLAVELGDHGGCGCFGVCGLCGLVGSDLVVDFCVGYLVLLGMVLVRCEFVFLGWVWFRLCGFDFGWAAFVTLRCFCLELSF